MKKLSEIPDIDKPREKLVKSGARSLTNHELLMVLVGSGVSGKDVSLVAYEILKIVENNKIGTTLDQLEKIQGVGVAKACQILAAFEFAKRFLIHDDKKIENTDDVLALVRDLRDKKQEHFVTLTLTGASTLIEIREVFKGTVDYSLVHPREIFADALMDRASGIIFVHNHPLDSPEPSKADIELTKTLCGAAKLLGIRVVDHIIVTKNDFYSFQREGALNL